ALVGALVFWAAKILTLTKAKVCVAALVSSVAIVGLSVPRSEPPSPTGQTATGISWAYDHAANEVVITGTNSRNMIQMVASSANTFSIISATPRPEANWPATNGWVDYRTYDTRIPLSSSLKIVVHGGDSHDFIMNMLTGAGQYAIATIHGNGGDAAIFSSGAGKDFLYGGDGDDLIYGNAGALVDGGAGNNSIRGGAGSVLLAQGGNNLIDVNGTEARVSGDPGNNTYRYFTNNPKATMDDFLKLVTDFDMVKDAVTAYGRTSANVGGKFVQPDNSDDVTILWSLAKNRGSAGSKSK